MWILRECFNVVDVLFLCGACFMLGIYFRGHILEDPYEEDDKD